MTIYCKKTNKSLIQFEIEINLFLPIMIINSPYAWIGKGEFCYFDFQWFIKSAALFVNRVSLF